MSFRQQEQRPYSGPHHTEHSQQYYNHAQASQFSLHTPTDPNPPNSSFGSPPGSPHSKGQFPPPSPEFLHMEHQQPPTTSATKRSTRVFDGEEEEEEESPDEFTGYSQGHKQQLPVEYGQDHEQQYQGYPQQYQSHEQQYQQPPTEYHEQYQGQEAQYQHPPAEYFQQHQHQGYGSQAQQRYSLPSSFPTPPSQFDSQSQANAQFTRRISEQYGPSPQYISPPHSPSFSPPPKLPAFPPPPTSPTFPPLPRSLTFPPPPTSPTFPPPPRSPTFPPPPRSLTFPPPPTSPTFPPPPASSTHPSQSSAYVPHASTFPPPPTSEIYQTMNADTSTPSPGVELAIVPHQQRPPVPPEPIETSAYNPGDSGPKTPVYTPGGGSGPNGGVHAPGQIGHPNQQHGKEMYHHGLCDCFSDISNCCMGYWCPCILYSRTNHRLKTSPNSNLNDFHTCNGHCMMFCALAPLSWIFTTIQRSRIREKYRLEGTIANDCGKAYCCVMCTLVQDDREVTDREDERRRFSGPGSGVVGDGGYKRETMIYERQ